MAIGLTPDEFFRQRMAAQQGLEGEQQAAEQVAGGAPAQLDPRKALETYRNLKDQGYDDDAIGRAFARHGWAMPATTGILGGAAAELWRGIKRGAISSAGSGLEGLGATFGSPGLIKYGQGLEQQAAAPELAGGVPDYTDIGKYNGGITRAADDVIRYGAGMLGSSLPESVAIAGAGLLAAEAVPAAPLIAGGIAAFSTGLLPNLGRNVQENIDAGATPEDVMVGGDAYNRAGAAAIGQSALDTVLSTRIAGLVKGAFVRSASPNMARRILKEAIIGAPIEGTTEAAQEALQMLAADPEIAKLVSPQGRQRLISAAVGGALVGGLLEGAAGVFPEPEEPGAPPPPPPGHPDFIGPMPVYGPPPHPPGPPPGAPGFIGPLPFVGPPAPPPGTPGERYGPHEAGPGTTVEPIMPPPGAGTPIGPAGSAQAGLDALAQQQDVTRRAREGGELFPNIREPREPPPPPPPAGPNGPRMVDLAKGTQDVGIIGRQLGLDALMPKDPRQAPEGIQQGAALHAATMAAAGATPSPELNAVAHADAVLARAKAEREAAAIRIAAQQADLDAQFPQVSGPFGDIPPPRTTPPAAGEEVSAAAPPTQPAAEAGVTPPTVALPPTAAAPASPFAPDQQAPTAEPAVPLATPEPPPPAAGVIAPVEQPPEPTAPPAPFVQENAGQNVPPAQPVATAGAVPLQQPSVEENLAGAPAPAETPAPPSLPAEVPPVASEPSQAFGQLEPAATGGQAQPAPPSAAEGETIADQHAPALAKLRKDLETKGAGRLGTGDYSVQSGDRGGFYWRKTKDGVRTEKGAPATAPWTRDEAINRAMVEAQHDLEADVVDDLLAKPEKPEKPGKTPEKPVTPAPPAEPVQVQEPPKLEPGPGTKPEQPAPKPFGPEAIAAGEAAAKATRERAEALIEGTAPPAPAWPEVTKLDEIWSDPDPTVSIDAEIPDGIREEALRLVNTARQRWAQMGYRGFGEINGATATTFGPANTIKKAYSSLGGGLARLAKRTNAHRLGYKGARAVTAEQLAKEVADVRRDLTDLRQALAPMGPPEFIGPPEVQGPPPPPKTQAEQIKDAFGQLGETMAGILAPEPEQPYRIRFSGPMGIEQRYESFATLEEAYARNRQPLPDGGYTMATIEEKQGKRWKFVASVTQKEPSPRPAPPEPTPAPPHEIAPTKSPDIVGRGDFGTIAEPDLFNAATHIAAEKLYRGDGFDNINAARSFVASMYGLDSIRPGTPEAKVVDELVELAGVLAARGKVLVEPEGQAFDAIAAVADRMPNLGTRTSTSVQQQAYSTPLPIAYVASRFAGVATTGNEAANSVYEPTAGQGALLIEASPQHISWANELNPDRAKSLEAQGFTVTQKDAATYSPSGVKGPGWAIPIPMNGREVVLANPPFGHVKNAAGENMSWQITWKGDKLYDTKEIDHAIAWQALAQMKPDGRAVLILGAPKENLTDRAKGYTAGAKQAFYLALYRKYNVTAHYTLAGELYAKQGASWPVDMIVINGQGASTLPLPAKQAPALITDLAGVKGLLADVASTYGKPGSAPAEGAPGGGVRVGTGEAGAGRPGGLGGVPGPAGGPGPVADQGEPGQRPAAGGEAVPGGPPAVGGAQPGSVPGGTPERDDTGPPAQPGPGPAAGAAEGPGGGAAPNAGRAPGGVGGGTGPAGQLEGLSAFDIDALIDAELDAAGIGSAPPVPKGVKAEPRKPRQPPAIWSLFKQGPAKTLQDHIKALQAQIAPLQAKLNAWPSGTPFTPAMKETARQRADLDRQRAALQRQLTELPKEEPKAAPPKKGKPPKGPKEEPKKGPKENLTTAATKALEAADEFMTGLFHLTGGGTSTLGSGFIFNEETYQKAIPGFKKAWKAAVEAGQALNEFIRGLLQMAAKMPAEWVRTVFKPMISRFLTDIQAGKIKLEDDELPPKPTDLQVLYSPRSTMTDPIGTLIPINMDQASREAFEAFEQEHGPVDDYVMKKLGYSEKELKDNFGGEQVDALALAIKTIDDGTGFIIGDQTGVGKGRVNAAIMRYAIRQGRTPIFVTEKPNLYSDMVRDLDAIGMRGFEPLVTNSDLSGKEAVPLPDGRILTTGKDHRNVLGHAAAAGKLEGPDGTKYDAIFTTYNQLQEAGRGPTHRNRFIEEFLPNGILILDESHNAGGSGAAPRGNVTSTPRSAILRRYVGMARSAFYSSATYAKRPDSMSLYFKTDISLAISDLSRIDQVFRRGGVPLQQVMSAMLTKAGQYLRRERSFEGVEFTPKPYAVEPEFAGRAAEAMREIVRFEAEVIGPIIAGIQAELAGEAALTGGDASQINSTNFTAMMHNVIDQMLLALKADAAAEDAIASLRAGEKTVIAVANTMGSLLGELVTLSNITPGERIDFSFRDVMLRYLDRTRWYSERDPHSPRPVRRYITDEELGEEGLRQYRAAVQLIKDLDFGGLPGSPIDHIKNKIEKAGFKIGEITGRGYYIDYSNEELGPTLRVRTGEKSKGQVVENIKKFNGGDVRSPIPQSERLDAFIINQSGATGLSLHSNKTFGDQRKRRMIVAQPERNIDTFMQMLGRIHRTGQVLPPAYTLAVADIPAEKRPAAVLLKKLASLNANTTASAESSLDVGDLPDFINENGDEVAASTLQDDMDLWIELQRPIGFDQHGNLDREDAMKKVTGRIPLLPVDRQEAIYDQLEQGYKDLIERKKAMGENVGAADSLDLDAKTIASTKIFEGVGTSPFVQPAYLEKVDVKRLGKPHTAEEVNDLVRRGLETAPDVRTVEQDFNAYLDKHMDEFAAAAPAGTGGALVTTAAPTQDSQDREDRERTRLEATMTRLRATMNEVQVGRTVRLVDLAPEGQSFFAVVVSAERKGKAKNPAANGAWRYTFAVADAMRRITLPVSKMVVARTMQQNLPGGMFMIAPWDETQTIDLQDGKPPRTVWQLFDELQSGSRENRYLVTGNVFAGFNHFKGKGQIAFYSDDQGITRQGVLMPRGFNGERELADQPQEIRPDKITEFLQASQHSVRTADGNLTIMKAGASQRYNIVTPRPRARGGRYFLNPQVLAAISPKEFVSVNQMMIARDLTATQVAAVAQAVNDSVGAIFAAQDQALARRIQGIPEPTFEERVAATGAENIAEAATAPDDAQFKGRPAEFISQPLSPRAEKQKASLIRGATQLAQRMNPRVAVQFADRLFGGGAALEASTGRASGRLEPIAGYHEAAKNLIKVALDASDADVLATTAHEAWHSLEPLLTAAEMETLKKAYPASGKRSQGEEIAHAFEDWIRDKFSARHSAAAKSIFARLLRFLKELGQMLRGRGFASVESIFAAAEAGTIGERGANVTPLRPAATQFARGAGTPFRVSFYGKSFDAVVGPNEADIRQAIRDSASKVARVLFRPDGSFHAVWPAEKSTHVEVAKALGVTTRTTSDWVNAIASLRDGKLVFEPSADFISTIRAVPLAEYQQTLAKFAAEDSVQFRGRRPATMPAYVADARPTWPESIVDTAKSISLTKKARERFWLHVAHNLTNSLASVNAMELRWAEAHGLPKHLLSAKDSAAKLGQMASDDGGRMAVAMEKAAMLWDARAGIARPHPTVKGLHWVAESLKTPEDYADATAYVYALRASRLIGEERENLMTEADIAAGLARGTPAALQFAERWEQFNDAMLQFAVDTGVLSPEQKASYQQYFYVPFYRQYEATGELMGPNELRRGLNNPSLRIHRLEGGTSKLGDLFENIVKNTATVVSAGVRNVAMQRIHGMLTDLGEAVDIPHWQEPKGDDVVSFYEEGKRRWFRPDDDLMFAALSGMRPETVNGVVRSLQKFSNMYRRGVTATPPFMLRNWIKGIVGTWIQTGRNVSLTTNSFTGMAAYAADDPIVDAIRAATGFGAYAFGEGGGMSGRHLRRKTFENKGFFGQVVKFWEGWEHVGEATEMADRIALAQNLLKAGVDEAEAYYQAANVMPYSRHGAAPWVRFLTLTVPFLNARLQGLARMIDTTSSVDARGRLAKRIILRGIIMTGFTAALWAINNSDEDKKRKYDRMTPDQRLMYWPLFLGDLMIKIPKPFEFGHVFATAMELALDAAYKDQGPHDALVVGLGALQQTFGFDTYVPLPQALVPALEVATNWDFWRQRPIENLGVSRLPPEQRTGPSVSSTAEAIAMGVDNILPNTVSPLQVEHLINGYLGIGGKVVTGIFDAIAGNLGFAPQRPSGVFGSGLPAGIASITGLDALVSRADVPLWDRWVEDFYRVKNLADEQYSGARAYALQGKIDDARDLIKDNPTLFRMRPIFNQAEAQLSKISQAMRQIRASELSGEEKRRRLDPLVKARNTTAETIMRTFNRVQANAGRRAA